jgi:DNA-binding CsgD family transcriptional regulator
MGTTQRKHLGRSADSRRAATTRRPLAQAADGAITRRELDILVLVSEGLSYRIIARTLAISARTASFHMVAVRGKLNAKNNAHAAALACRGGLLPVEPKTSRDL